jgi:hypothetical protein
MTKLLSVCFIAILAGFAIPTSAQENRRSGCAIDSLHDHPHVSDSHHRHSHT